MSDEKEKRLTLPTDLEVTVNIPAPRMDDDADIISMKRIVSTMRKSFLTIIAVTMICVVIGITAALAYFFVTKPYDGTVTALISYGYKGADEGIDPMGRPLDVSKIKSPYVIEQALVELDLSRYKVTTEDVRANISIEGVLPQDVMQRILIVKEIATKDPTRLEELTDIQYHSTQYTVTLAKTGNLKGLANKTMVDLLNSILKHYSNYFIEEYSDKYIFETISENFDQLQYDYVEVIQILNSQVRNMITYCETKRNAAPDFRSPTTNMTFGDIITNLEIIRTVDISRVSAIVYAGKMSRDRDKLGKIYEYNITRLTMERNTALENAQAANQMAEMYQKDSMLVMSSMGETQTFNTSSGIYDSFLSESLTYTKRAAELQEDIEFYKERLEALMYPPYSNMAQDVAFVEEAIPDILTTLQNWADISNQTADDYLILESFKDATKVVIPAHYSGVFSEYFIKMILIVVGTVAAGVFLSILAAIWKDAFPKE